MLPAELEHALEALDVDHFDCDGERAGLFEPLGAVLPRQTEQGFDLPHASPGKRDVEQHLRSSSRGRAVAAGLSEEESGVALCVRQLLFREIRRIRTAPSRWLSGMGFDQHAAIVEAHQLAVGPRPQPPPEKLPGERVERLGDLGVLIPRDLRITRQWDVV